MAPPAPVEPLVVVVGSRVLPGTVGVEGPGTGPADATSTPTAAESPRGVSGAGASDATSTTVDAGRSSVVVVVAVSTTRSLAPDPSVVCAQTATPPTSETAAMTTVISASRRSFLG